MMTERTVASALSRRSATPVQAAASVRQTARLMAETDRGSFLVFAGDEFVGIVTEADIVHAISDETFDSERTAVRSIMRRKSVCVPGETSIIHAIYTMKELGLRYLPVLDPQGRPIGIFGLHDAFPSELARADMLATAREKIATDGG